MKETFWDVVKTNKLGFLWFCFGIAVVLFGVLGLIAHWIDRLGWL